jgi:TolB-like protein/DNA-binding transcriptional regulator YiaG
MNNKPALKREGVSSTMATSIPTDVLERVTSFGELLRYLRRRVGLTQTELSIAVGYSDAQISRLEQNVRLPDIAVLESRFLPVLRLQNEPAARLHLLELAKQAQRNKADTEIATHKTKTSIAVLPFVNLSANPDNDYFCDGLAEELLNALTKIKGLFVVARGSAFSFKGQNLDVRDIGSRLGVQAILEGSVNTFADRIRVSVRLVNTESGFQLWAERYDRMLTDLFALQDEIALTIIQHLKVELLEKERSAILARGHGNLEAYNLYLKGRYYWAQRPQGIAKAIEYFELAIDQDPLSALARAGLADCYVTLGSWENGTMAPAVAMDRAKKAAQRALDIDGRLAEAHASLAYRTTHHDWDWAAAEAQFKRALELNPNYAIGHHWYSHLLMATGRTAESYEASKRCLELDPLDQVINFHMAWHHLFSHHYEEAIEQCMKADELHPDSLWRPYFVAMARHQLGQLGQSIAEYESAVKKSGKVTFAKAGLGHVYGFAGEKTKARQILDELRAQSKYTYVPAYDLALVCIGLGWKDQAFEWLIKTHEEHSGWLTYLQVEPRLNSLRGDPRFDELLRRAQLAN